MNRTGSGVRLRLAFESSLSEEELTETAILKGCLVKPMKSFYEIYSEGTKKVFFFILCTYSRGRFGRCRKNIA